MRMPDWSKRSAVASRALPGSGAACARCATAATRRVTERRISDAGGGLPRRMPADGQLPPACRYCSTTELGIRPRAGTATLLAPAHSRSCRMSKSRFRLAPFVDGAALRRVVRDDVELRRDALT